MMLVKMEPIYRTSQDLTTVNTFFMIGIGLFWFTQLIFSKDYDLVYFGKNKLEKTINPFFNLALSLIYILFLSLSCLPFTKTIPSLIARESPAIPTHRFT